MIQRCGARLLYKVLVLVKQEEKAETKLVLVQTECKINDCKGHGEVKEEKREEEGGRGRWNR